MPISWLIICGAVIVALPLISIGVGALIIHRASLGPGVHALGSFLYSFGLWFLFRCIIGALGALLAFAAFLWGLWKEADEKTFTQFLEHLTDKLKLEELRKFKVEAIIAILIVVALTALLGKKLWEISGKHRQVAARLFQRLMKGRVPPELPNGGNTDAPVLAYFAVTRDQFGVSAVERIDGWSARQLRRRVNLIYYVPIVTGIHPQTGRAGDDITITGSKLGGAQRVDFGSAPAGNLRVDSDTQIRVTAPGGSGSHFLRVSSYAGIRSLSSAQTRFFYPAATVLANTP